MAVKYNKQLTKNGAAIGTVVSIVKPSTYTSSNTESVEASNWNISANYPGWIECDGRTLNVSEYRALYSVIGNTYGGTTGTTFKLPDFRSKKICGTGAVNGNNGASLTLTPTKNASGGTGGGGGANEAGSTGGIYTISTIRQLPSDSEITAGSPSNPVSIGGDALDTFSLGTFRTAGFSSITVSSEPVLSGTVTFGIGPLKDVSVSAVPPHVHLIDSVDAGTQTANVGSPEIGASYNFFEKGTGNIISFNRGRRPWPGAGGDFGDFEFLSPVSALSITFTGTALQNYGPGTGETSGFESPSDGPNGPGQYLAFGTYGTSPFNSIQITRRAVLTVDASKATDFVIEVIGGNDSNGGERCNSAGDSIYIQFGSSAAQLLLPSVQDSGLSGSAWDDEYQTWKTRNYTIPTAQRVANLQITIFQNVASYEGEQATPGGPNAYDMWAISKIGLSGPGGSFTYEDALAANPIQRHAHAIFWNTPNTGDTIPSIVSTYGIGGGVDNGYTLTGGTIPTQVTPGAGLRTGQNAGGALTANNSIGTSLTKTLDILNDIGNSMNPAVITLSDSSRVAFDNAIDVRLQAADQITMLTPYFRAKYIIKAY